MNNNEKTKVTIDSKSILNSPIFVFVLATFIVSVIIIVIMNNKLNESYVTIENKDKAINSYEMDIENDLRTIENFEEALNQSELISKALTAKIDSLNKEIEHLNEQLVDREDAVIEMSEKLEVYEDFSYVTYVWGKRTDLSYDDIVLGRDLMKEKGYNPHLLFSMICLESSGDRMCYNTTSGASGLGQFLGSTGKWVYEDLLGNGKGTYDHNVTPFDVQTNIRMTVAYLDYLYKQCNGDVMKVLSAYSGRSGDSLTWYINNCQKFITVPGVNIYDMSVRIK